MDIEIVFAVAMAVGVTLGLGLEYVHALSKTRKLFDMIDDALEDGELTEEEAVAIVRKAMSVKDAYEELWKTITMKGYLKGGQK